MQRNKIPSEFRINKKRTERYVNILEVIHECYKKKLKAAREIK